MSKGQITILTTKERFQEFSQQHFAQLSFSMRYEWWKEVVKDSWDVAVIEKGGQTTGIWPYFFRKKGPWKMIAQAPLTPYAGPFLLYPEGQKNSSKISYEHKQYEALIKQLPKVAEINLSFPIDFKNGLAFQWNAFEEHVKYTYLLNLKRDQAYLWSNLRENVRRQIKKAEKKLRLEVAFNYHELESAMRSTFEHQSQSYPLTDNYLERITQYLQKHKCGKLYLAYEKEQLHSAIAVVFDTNTAYYLVGGSIQAHKNSGAMSMLMWQAIRDAKAMKLDSFNFEGSSIPSIEKYLRGFGGELHPFRRMIMKNSKSLEVLKKLKS